MEQVIDDLAAALDATRRVVASVGNDQWSLPTPCTEWDVADVVRHLVRGNMALSRQLVAGDSAGTGYATAFGPQNLEPATTGRSSGGGSRGTPRRPSLSETFDRTRNELLHAFASSGALERVVNLSAGRVPGAVAARIRSVDVLVHAWDIGAATGVAVAVEEELATRALEFTSQHLASVADDGRRPFAPARPVVNGAPALDRLAGLLGREVPWGPAF